MRSDVLMLMSLMRRKRRGCVDVHFTLYNDTLYALLVADCACCAWFPFLNKTRVRLCMFLSWAIVYSLYLPGRPDMSLPVTEHRPQTCRNG